jgi:hypothetical protein
LMLDWFSNCSPQPDDSGWGLQFLRSPMAANPTS